MLAKTYDDAVRLTLEDGSLTISAEVPSSVPSWRVFL